MCSREHVLCIGHFGGGGKLLAGGIVAGQSGGPIDSRISKASPHWPLWGYFQRLHSRKVADLSSLLGESVNDGFSVADSFLSHISVDDIAKEVAKMRVDSLLGKNGCAKCI